MNAPQVSSGNKDSADAQVTGGRTDHVNLEGYPPHPTLEGGVEGSLCAGSPIGLNVVTPTRPQGGACCGDLAAAVAGAAPGVSVNASTSKRLWPTADAASGAPASTLAPEVGPAPAAQGSPSSREGKGKDASRPYAASAAVAIAAAAMATDDVSEEPPALTTPRRDPTRFDDELTATGEFTSTGRRRKRFDAQDLSTHYISERIPVMPVDTFMAHSDDAAGRNDRGGSASASSGALAHCAACSCRGSESEGAEQTACHASAKQMVINQAKGCRPVADSPTKR